MRRGPLRLLPLLSLLSFSVSACASSSDFPLWLDSLQRLPIKSVLVDGRRVAYLDSGQGPPVILIHGLGGSLWNWEYQQAALAVSHRLFTLDLLGSGFSDKPNIDYTPETLLEFFRGFMDAVGVERAALVGNSLGAGVAIGMALTHPERVDRLVLIGGLPDHVREKAASPMVHRTLDSSLPAWLVTLGNRFTGRGTTRRILEEIVHDPALLTPAVIDRSYRNRSQPGVIWPLLSLAHNLDRWEKTFAKRLSEVRPPTLIVWGAEDRVFPPEVGRELHRTIPGSAFELIPKAGHMPQWEQPDLVNSVLVRFLQP